MELSTLQKDMIAAMKARDKERKDAISSLVSAVKKAAIDGGCREDVPESLVDQVILKEQKSVKEQIDTCPEERQDLKAEYQFRYDVISEYAPKQMDIDEIRVYISNKFGNEFVSRNKSSVIKQIGNAVPPLLAYYLANVIKNVEDGKYDEE